MNLNLIEIESQSELELILIWIEILSISDFGHWILISMIIWFGNEPYIE